MKYLKRKKKQPLWLEILADLVAIGLILVVFAFSHHVLPQMVARYEFQQAQLNATEPPATEPPETEPAVTSEPTEATEPEETTEPTEATEPDPRTEWQKKFEEHFTQEPILTLNSYTSPEVSITVEKIRMDLNGNPVTYYLADIYIASGILRRPEPCGHDQGYQCDSCHQRRLHDRPERRLPGPQRYGLCI